MTIRTVTIPRPHRRSAHHRSGSRIDGREGLPRTAILPLLLFLACPPPAHGNVTITVVESAGGVTVTASGTINLEGLTEQGNVFSNSPKIDPAEADFALGAGSIGIMDVGDTYRANDGESITHPTSLGLGGATLADSGSGLLFGFTLAGSFAPDLIQVPDGFESGGSINSSAFFSNTTIANLGLRPGQYTWSWGSGGTAESITMTVPEPFVPVTFADLYPGLDPEADDTDNDNGLSNFVDYATGFDPNVFVSPALVHPSLGPDRALTLRRRNDAADVSAEWQKSSTLLPGSWIEMVPGSDYSLTSSTSDGDRDIIVLQLLFEPASQTPMFVRQAFDEAP